MSALILLSPVFAFLMVLAAEMVIDLAMETGRTTVCVVAAGAIGWVLYRKKTPHPEASQWEPEQEPDQAAIAAPPM
jgi:hypothetical protein